MYFLIAFTVLELVSGQILPCPDIDISVIYEWKTPRYAIPANYHINSSLYHINSTIITGLEVGSDYFYLATPNAFTINPFAVSTVPKNRLGLVSGQPLLQPFPDISWYRQRYSGNIDCHHSLISVFRMAKDKCNRLWVVDTGLINGLSSPQRVCPAKIVVFDLSTKKAVKNVILPNSVVPPGSLPVNIVLDDNFIPPNRRKTCDDVYVYIADSRVPGLIVYSSGEDFFYRISHPDMFPEPGYGRIRVDGESYEDISGIIGMDLLFARTHWRLFFQPLASLKVFSIRTSDLQRGPVNDSSELDVREEFRKDSQGIALHTDKSNGCLLFNPIEYHSINAWRYTTRTQREVAKDRAHLHVVEDIKENNVISGIHYAVSSREQKFFNGDVDLSEINLRLLRFTNLNFIE